MLMDKVAIEFLTSPNPLWWYYERRRRDRMYQSLMNNLYDNNPGELDRWADDGGTVL